MKLNCNASIKAIKACVGGVFRNPYVVVIFAFSANIGYYLVPLPKLWAIHISITIN
uniref:Uncharacterized protein n=1 Tax=Cajanus cajan TaxID=3821 RepID=A0A151TVM5_CAJCA|nr:hypothetical protein KK1_010344 [Cajanus cajan]